MSQPPDQRKPKRDASLSKLSIQNFKAFGEMVDVPIRPITLIFGENSSGKSSILHSLLFLNQMQYQPQEQLADITYTKIGGNSVDLGGIPQLLYKHSENNKLQFRIEVLCDIHNLTVKSLKNKIINLLEKFPHLKSLFTLTVVLTLSKDAALEQVDYLIDNIPACSLTTFKIDSGRIVSSKRSGSSNYLRLRSIIDGINQSIFPYLAQNSFFHEQLIEDNIYLQHQTKELFDNFIKIINDNMNIPDLIISLMFRDTIINSSALLFERLNRHNNGYSVNFRETTEPKNNQEQNIILHFMRRLLETVSDLQPFAQISNITYLGPIRTIPTRNFDTLDSINRDPSTGSTAWDKLANDEQLRTHVNFWLDKFGTNKQITTEQLVDTAQLRKIVSESVSTTQIEDIIKQLATRNLLRFYDPQKDIHLSHRDLGVGISQVLPVLVNSIANSDTTVLIEQPELHLHPRLQGDLADLFIDTAIKGEQQNTYIIETHSEALILRLLRRVREGVISPDDIAILYVSPSEHGSMVKHIRIDAEGDFLDRWPNGFFEETYRDRMGF